MKHHWQNGLVDSKYASTSSVPPRPVRSNVNYSWCLVGMRACTRVNVYTITSRVYTRLQNCTIAYTNMAAVSKFGAQKLKNVL